MANFCEQCGNKVENSERFCSRCGKAVNQAPQRAAMPMEKIPPQPYIQNVKKEEGKKRKSKLWIVLLIIIVAVASAAGGYFMANGKDKEKDSPKEKVTTVWIEETTEKSVDAEITYESDENEREEVTSDVKDEAVKKELLIATGGEIGTYYEYGYVLSSVIGKESGLMARRVPSDGSKSNIVGVCNGDYQLGFAQSDIINYAYNDERVFEEDGEFNNLRVVATLYSEQVQLISVDPEIQSVADLKGKEVAVGAIGSGVYYNAIDILAAAGLSEDDIIPRYFSITDAMEFLERGEFSAAFVVAGAPTPTVSELFSKCNASIVPIGDEIADKLISESPYYSKSIVPAHTYADQYLNTETVEVNVALITDSSMPDKVIYDVTKEIFDNMQELSTLHTKGAELSLDKAVSDMGVPMHPGAEQYFREKGVLK